jgi:hypothetical protein
MKKRTKIALGIVAFILIGAYLSLWFYSARWFHKEIDRLYADETDNVVFLGKKPALGNFPFVPTVNYHGGLQIGNAEILFPQVRLKGYPLPGTTLKIDFPLGVSLGGMVDPKIWNLDSLKAGVAIPYRFPEDFTYEGLSAWREGGGTLTVRSYEMTKGTLRSEGKGHLFLDAQLQPDLNFESEVRGYQEFIAEQQRAGLIQPFAAAGAIMLLNSLSSQDEKTGESLVRITVTVKNGILSAGPIQALELPPIVWGRRSQPDPHL